MQCDMCGISKGEFVHAIVEGSMMQVCSRCSKFGAVIEKHPHPPSHPHPDGQAPTQKRPPSSTPYHYSEPAQHIHQEFPSTIKLAREKKRLSQEELAAAIAEKLSVIQKIESGSLQPQVKLCKKLEQFLNIKLILSQPQPAQQEEKKKQLDLRNQNLTIGDLLSLKR